MTKYANTPAGRAAAAADMAATGTTMGRRPTGPKGPMVQPGVPSGPKIGVRPADPKPANPRVTYGPRGPRGYGPNDGPVTGGIPAGMTKDEYLGTFTDRKPFDTEGKPRPMGPRSVAPYDDTPTATRTPSGPGKTKYPLDSNGNYIIPPGTVTQTILGGSLGLKKGGAVKSKAMRGGGLARKGVGMALAKGGLARRAGGCAQRGVGRGKIT